MAPIKMHGNWPPYYAFFFPVLLIKPGHLPLMRLGWWQRVGLLLMSFTALLLVLAPGRPLFPAKAVIGGLRAKYPHSKFISQTWHYVSRISGEERRNFFKKNLPAGESVLGYAAVFDADEPGLWLPDGQRRVERLLMDDTPERLHSLGIHYVVLEDSFLKVADQTLEQWMNKYNADLVSQLTYAMALGGESGNFTSFIYAPGKRTSGLCPVNHSRFHQTAVGLGTSKRTRCSGLSSV